MQLTLSPVETRVLASLVEKSLTTPQYYPMTVNAIMLAANQRSARWPLMALAEGEVGAALLQLEEQGLCSRDDLAGRVPKWRHAFQHRLLLKPPTMMLLAVLMLRGPQTQAELRSHASSLGAALSNEALEAALEDLADRAQPLVRSLPRQPGQSTARYTHLLSGEPTLEALPAPAPPLPRERDALGARMEALEARMAALEALLAPKNE